MGNAPYMYWVGIDLPADTDAGEVQQFNDFYTRTHAPEVVANYPGFIRGVRYELSGQDPRGDFGPRFLAVYEMDGVAAADGYIARNADPAAARAGYTPGPPVWNRMELAWRMIWRRIAPESGELGHPPYLYLIGMNIPADTDEAGLAEFNDFYTNVHVPEVVGAYGFESGARYELYREFLHPAPGSPRFLAVYEAGERAVAKLRERRENPQAPPLPMSEGPPVWDAHDTLWRLEYQRID